MHLSLIACRYKWGAFEFYEIKSSKHSKWRKDGVVITLGDFTCMPIRSHWREGTSAATRQQNWASCISKIEADHQLLQSFAFANPIETSWTLSL